MKLSDAINILKLTPDSVNAESIKKAYRDLAKVWHPDVNPAGLQMMQLLNEAMTALRAATADELEKSSDYFESDRDFGAELNEFLQKIIHLPDLKIEICGVWLWIGGDTRPVQFQLKEAGAFWASSKKLWYFRPKVEARRRRRGNWDMGKIRMTYGSGQVRGAGRLKLAGGD